MNDVMNMEFSDCWYAPTTVTFYKNLLWIIDLKASLTDI
jgi:hypothetical protein